MKDIKDFFIKNRHYSSFIIRIGLALVLLWFGIDEIINPQNWFGYFSQWLALPFSLETFFLLNGIFEVIIGILLLMGLYTRVVAFISAFHLLAVTIALGYNDVAVRDFGLTLMAVSLVFSGAGVLSLDNRKSKNTYNK